MNFKFQISNFKLFKSSHGFTLIELLIVIAIIGVLSTLLMTNFVGIRQRARDGQRKSNLRQIQASLELYRSDQGAYISGDNMPVCNNQLAAGGNVYMSKIPCDPVSSSQSYIYVSDGSLYCLRACLENASDSEVDVSDPTTCTNLGISSCTSGKSYTLQNP